MMLGLLLLGAALSLAFAQRASAHGYLEAPTSRTVLCQQGQNTGCGPIQYEPQSVEGKGSFPESGPVDGQITGADKYPDLYEQTSDRWKKVTLKGGKQSFTWHLTAQHSTKEWKYYITKKDWDPNKPLTRSELELVCSFNDGGAKPAATVTHECNLPTDRSGYQLLLGVWEIADTGNAFYQVIDVNLVNDGTGGPVVEIPTTPTQLKSTAQTDTSINLSWLASMAPSGIKHYEVYRDGKNVGIATQPSYEDKGLKPSTSYTYLVVSICGTGGHSAPSQSVTVSTKASTTPPMPVDTQAPTVPYNVQSGSQTDASVALAWSASTDNVGVVKYDVYRNGGLVGTVTQPSYTDTGLAANTPYSYSIVALDAAGNQSARSSELKVTTKPKSSPTTDWDTSKVYLEGNRVTYKGLEYAAKWWTQGEQPDSSDVWKLVSADVVQAWSSSRVYVGQAKVSYEGKIYLAKWWTKGEVPGKSDVWTLAK
ncbi:lytic polysaccharide monooxygenase [Paenibacillus sp. SYP-B3998]|nr:lytic polysaccharide monooxygenase [Paenibacillus sp. SYP-B3998]